MFLRNPRSWFHPDRASPALSTAFLFSDLCSRKSISVIRVCVSERSLSWLISAGEILRDSRPGLLFIMLNMILPSLPPVAAGLCDKLAAPALLVRHLTLVHAAAVELLDGLHAAVPDLFVDDEAVLLGASIHDIGKVLHPGELVGPGNQHEQDGPDLLIKHGVLPRMARFAATHARWRDVDDLEDLLVALADNVWRGRRVDELETRIAVIVAAATGVERWEAWSKLDAMCEMIASKGEERLAWQRDGDEESSR